MHLAQFRSTLQFRIVACVVGWFLCIPGDGACLAACSLICDAWCLVSSFSGDVAGVFYVEGWVWARFSCLLASKCGVVFTLIF